jgi:preprotein translocase subunit SecF
MLQIFSNPKYDFMGIRKYGYLFSGIILALSIGFVARHWSRTGDPLNYGIDFRGGTIMQVRFQEPPDIGRLRDALRDAGFASAAIQAYGAAAENSILIRLSEQLEERKDLVSQIRTALRPEAEREREAQGLLDLNTTGEADIAALLESELTGTVSASPDPMYLKAAKAVLAQRGHQPAGMFTDLAALKDLTELTGEMQAALGSKTYLGSLAFLKTESVGPAVGKDLRNKALLASIVANGFILLYLWFRFELRFGVAAVLCLLHDVIFIVGVFAFTNREFDLTVLAAILTVIGYSVNDTVVVFDRVRSNLRLMKKAPLEEVLNTSINQTLSRTLLTSCATLFVVIALYLFGGEVLNSFAFALLIGILEGTYSSIFVAAPLLLVWRRLFAKA